MPTNVKNSPKNSPKQPSLTERIEQLDQAVEWFYGDDFDLDQSLTKYQDASKLAAEINRDLTELKNQVEVVEDFTKD